MPTTNISAMSTGLDAHANLALSDLALNAAIELERFQLGGKGNLEALGQLAKALSDDSLPDLALVPVYDRALTGRGNAASTKSDLYSRVHEIASKMQSTKGASTEDLNIIRDFCLALHDALLANQ